MKRELQDQLAQAAYLARRACLATGVYPKIAFTVPSSTQYYEWSDLDELLASFHAVKSVYRKEGEAVLNSFFAFVVAKGSPEAKKAMERMISELKDVMLTDEEQAAYEVGQEYQRSINKLLSQPGATQEEIAILAKRIQDIADTDG
jgi:hypothetical protein